MLAQLGRYPRRENVELCLMVSTNAPHHTSSLLSQAGTHNHRHLLEQKPSASVPKTRSRGVWVPAFAGTTGKN
jgi:hypothetical protein